MASTSTVASQPVRANPALMARVSASMAVGGALIAFVAMALPHPAQIDDIGMITVGACAATLGAYMLTVGERLPAWSFHLVEAYSTALITAAIYLAGQSETGPPVNVELVYLFPTLFSAYFFSRAGAIAQIALVGVAFGGLLVFTDAPAALQRWIVTMGTLTTVGIVVNLLVERVGRDFAARQQTTSLLEATLESTADGILVVDAEGRMVSWNSKFTDMWRIPERVMEGRDDDAAIDSVLEQLRHPDRFVAKVRELYDQREAASFDLLEFKDGRVFERYSQPRLLGGEYVGRVWSFRDVTERRRFESQLQHLADHDPLTDLYNRRRFEEELDREAKLSARRGYEGAVLLLDLDNFKYV